MPGYKRYGNKNSEVRESTARFNYAKLGLSEFVSSLLLMNMRVVRLDWCGLILLAALSHTLFRLEKACRYSAANNFIVISEQVVLIQARYDIT